MNLYFLDFMEIGTSDFDSIIEISDDNTIGISVEPIKFYLDKLPNKNNIKKINCAISNTNGECLIYYINDENIKKYNLPWWIKGCNSIDKIHPKVNNYLRDIKIKDNLFEKQQINKYTLNTFIIENKISGIFLLKIDTEGHDCIILQKFIEEYDNNLILPHNIKFETNKLTSKYVVRDTINFLNNIGYDLISSCLKSDTYVKLNLNKLKKRNIFTDKINNYIIKNDFDENNLLYDNTFDSAKQYCIKINGTGINFIDGKYIVSSGNYIEKAKENICTFLYL